jgi:hypothetical protein
MEAIDQAPADVAEPGEILVEDLSLAEAGARCREALWRTEHTLHPPVDEDFTPQVAAVAAHVRTLPDDVTPVEPAEISDAEREAALEGFLASPQARDVRERDDLVDLATLAIHFCADYVEGEGRPLRWSPAVIELFMTSYLPRKVVREPEFFRRAVPTFLPLWVRYAGGARGIPEAAIDEAVEAVGAFREEMLSLVGDASAWGPAKAFAAAANEAGVDLADEAALEAFIGEYNAGLPD